jgi:acyl-coenzyme A synthetase/AMP-(fatty) acid ligase
VQKGDRVVIYMPLTLEGVISMLACARLGAIHSVVYAGMGVGALRDRILDAGAKVVIAGNIGMRRGKASICAASSTRRWKTCRCVTSVWYQRGVKAELRPREVDFDETVGRVQARRGAGTGRCRAPALHPLHLRLHRQAQRRGACPWRLHGGHQPIICATSST